MTLPEEFEAQLQQGLVEDVELANLTTLLTKAAQNRRRLTVKLGVDPTSPQLHLGHAAVLRKLRFFQDLGHQAVLVIGDFTASIGDPSGVNKTRPVLSKSQIASNMVSYVQQASLVLNAKATRICYNSRWYLGREIFGRPMRLDDFIGYCMQISVNNLIERKDFQTRLKAGESVALHELIYPVIMAIDSVKLKADVEIGGYDQRLNLLLGRELQKKVGQNPQEIVMTKLLLGTDGKRKMSSSYDNFISLTEKPNEMFGKLMSIPDEQIDTYGELLLSFASWQALKSSTLPPRDRKAMMAKAVVATFTSSPVAEQAQKQFDTIFRDKQLDVDSINQLKVSAGAKLIDIVVQAAGTSRSQASRLLEQKAVKVNEMVQTDPSFIPDLAQEPILQVGKRGFYKLILS